MYVVADARMSSKMVDAKGVRNRVYSVNSSQKLLFLLASCFVKIKRMICFDLPNVNVKKFSEITGVYIGVYYDK